MDFDISKCLRQTLTSGSTEHALSLLTSWLLEASEKRTKITHEILFEKIKSIGRYFAEREAHHHEWFKSVTPLESNNTIEKHSLEKEYYRGVSTRFSHIQAQLDILRQDQLTEIDNQFKISQTGLCFLNRVSEQNSHHCSNIKLYSGFQAYLAQ